ncbi:uncharacterized protein MELLADRAFT_94958 [Melampsora larici-populina 98AG31]|uniref:RRM domain-containing protein n=1 Tax=Melampsora larici-populina (strain 98AG31 / pathotype 3-4-7) TaxID=747676 RepID=F4S8G8_MELLP|nr:uncharacterized protein MELLADRAFT_94958 [Melampsora larici-populina 98AG31]EGF99019.1 hypothetical protein MELLADRAFT_94958 [Melampsora larici-populina 98AG31]
MSNSLSSRSNHEDRWAWLDLSDDVSRSVTPMVSSTSDDSTERSECGLDGDGDRSTSPSTSPTSPATALTRSSHSSGGQIQSAKFFRTARNPYPPLSFPKIRDRYQKGPINRTAPSPNVYIRPLPPSFTDGDLEKLCTSATLKLSSAARHKILSVKVMVEEGDTSKIGVCKGYGFCLWSSTQAASICIDGLRGEGYQASFARETSRGMLSSLADPSSANVYLSNLPHHWVEQDLIALFGDTPISSIRLLRERDDENMGASGTNRGVGFVSRKLALHFVQALHGLAVDGTDHHIQCRMADSKAQKEWKRTARSRHDLDPFENINSPDLKVHPNLKFFSETSNKNQRIDITSPISSIRSPQDSMSPFSGTFSSTHDGQPASLTATAPPFVMPMLSSPFETSMSSPSEPSSLNATPPAPPPTSLPILNDHHNHAYHPPGAPLSFSPPTWYHTNMSYSQASFVTPCSPQFPPNDQFMRPQSGNTAINFFYVSGDPQQQNYSHDLQMYPADPYSWEAVRPQIYAPTTTESHPSPGICFSGPFVMPSPTQGTDQARFETQGVIDSESEAHE